MKNLITLLVVILFIIGMFLIGHSLKEHLVSKKFRKLSIHAKQHGLTFEEAKKINNSMPRWYYYGIRRYSSSENANSDIRVGRIDANTKKWETISDCNSIEDATRIFTEFVTTDLINRYYIEGCEEVYTDLA